MAKKVVVAKSQAKTKPAKKTPKAQSDGEDKTPKFRGLRGNSLELPAYATWTWIFETQRKLANGEGPVKVGSRTFKKPLTDDQIVEFLQEEFNGELKEGTPNGVNRLRSLYNKGKINKQEAPPKVPIGVFDEDGNESVRDRSAKKAEKATSKKASTKAKTKKTRKPADEEEEEDEDEDEDE